MNSICGRWLIGLTAVIAGVLAGCSSMKEGNMSLDGTWLFKIDSLDVGQKEGWFVESRDRSDWIEMDLPAYWDRYNLQSYDGVGWFARTVTVSDTSEPMALFFAGVDDDADVWVNGKSVGGHTGYSEAFWLDVSHVLRTGKNVIVVRVKDNSGSGGIYKPITLVQRKRVDDLLRSKYADESARPSADWVKNAILYEVYVRSFSKEGTFQGVEKRIPELKQLGVTVLWLMPIHPVGEANRKGSLGSSYSVQDYYGINPEYGTLDDFKSLVRTVHDNGLRIIIDLVANHTSWDSKLMFEHSDWFTTDDSGAIVAPNADWTDVADLNYNHHELRKYMIEMMKYWVRDIGIDGYRCDVAELVPTDFWEVARRELDKIKPVMMLSEGTLPEHHVEAFDLTYSWNVYDALLKVLGGNTSASIFSDILRNESYQFPKGSLRMRFSSNHDKNFWDKPAFVKFGPSGARTAAALTMTLPGVPLIYNGDEAGNEKPLNLFEKVPIEWMKHPELREFYRQLCSLRIQHSALRDGSFMALTNSDSTRVFSFERQDSSERVLSVLNFSREPKQAVVTIGESDSPKWNVELKGGAVTADSGKLTLKLPALGFVILSQAK